MFPEFSFLFAAFAESEIKPIEAKIKFQAATISSSLNLNS
jgi:hypothetical protein